MANNYPVILSFSDILVYAKEHNILSKLKKALKYLALDIRHSSLKTELLNPKHKGIYSLTALFISCSFIFIYSD